MAETPSVLDSRLTAVCSAAGSSGQTTSALRAPQGNAGTLRAAVAR